MKFLLDQGVARSTVMELAKHGILAEHVGQLGMSTAIDERILAEAVNRSAVVVTMDADFHTLLAVRKAREPSVIRIRIEGLKGAEVADIVRTVVDSVSSELTAGAAVTVTRSGIRVRLLPLV